MTIPRLRITASLLVVLLLCFSAAGQNPGGGKAVSSASLTNWETALDVFLSSRNQRLVDRALRLLEDPLQNLPATEQEAAREHLEQLVRQGFTKRARPEDACLFAASQRQKREALFDKLQKAPWAAWNGASLKRLLTKFAETPVAFDSAALLHEDFLAFCRQCSTDVPEELVEQIVRGYTQSDFFHGLCFAHQVHPGATTRWQTVFRTRYGNEPKASDLWAGFTCLDSDIWDGLAGVRQGYQRDLGDQLFQRDPLADWAGLGSGPVSRVAAASSHPGLEWQFKLGQSLKKQRHAAGLQLLYDLCAKARELAASYDKLALLFADGDQTFQEFFIYLHSPASSDRSLLRLLNEERENWRRSVRSLAGYLAVEREADWDEALYPLLKDYYREAAPAEREEMVQKVIAPIYQCYAAKPFPDARKQNPIRARLLDETTGAACFLDLAAHQGAATWFRSQMSLQDPIRAGNRTLPNFRFVAEATLAAGERRLSGDRTRDAAKAVVEPLAQWGEWMLQGMLEQPQALGLDNNQVNDALSLVLGKLRDLKQEFGLKPEELGLEILFGKLNQELSNAVNELRHRGDASGIRRDELQRVVRSVHLSLVVSAILEDRSQLDTILAIVRRDLFGLQETAQFRVLDPAALDFTVTTFLQLDEDLTKCLAAISRPAGNGPAPAMGDLARAFFLKYHLQVQVGLIRTDGFLAAINQRAPGPLPLVRLLDAQAGGWLRPFDDNEARTSFESVKTALAESDFLNSEQAVISLVEGYRRRLGLQLWMAPLACGTDRLNANVNLMVLLRLLRDEPPPPLAQLAGGAAVSAASWPRPALLPVIDCFLQNMATGGADLRLKKVEYTVAGTAISRSAVEHHPSALFAEFTERLLRAQEMASFPILANGNPVACEPHIDALVRDSLSDEEVELPSLGIPPGETGPTRSLDGARRLQLIETIQKSAGDFSPARLAHFATFLPNDPDNACDPARLGDYDRCRESVFRRLSQWLQEPNAASEGIADALIAALRLEFSQRDRAPAIAARELAESLKARLTPAGRQRLVMEILMQAEGRDRSPVRVGCEAHSQPDVSCAACRGSLAKALERRLQELVDVRRLCAEQLNLKYEGPPKTRFEVIGQLSRAIQRVRDASKIIQQIDEDSARAAFRLLKQVKRAYAMIPAPWTGNSIRQQVTSADDPLAVALTALERVSAAMYCDLLPFYGDFDTQAILGNPDALVVFSLFDAELKAGLLRSVPLTTALSREVKELQVPIGTPETTELVLVHSIVQPSLAVAIWEQGHTQVGQADASANSRKCLIEFVAQGKSYDESYFDRDLVYVVSSQFTLSPSKLFEEAFKGIDTAAQAAEQYAGAEQDGDAFIYEAWFGDLRAALRRQVGQPQEQFNLDRFVRRAATIPTDRRYEGPEFEAVRPFAAKFQQELGTWLESSGPSALGGMLQRASSVHTLVALGGGICGRLGLAGATEADVVEPGLRAAYADFCSKILFARSSGGQTVYPRPLAEKLLQGFYAPAPTDKGQGPTTREQFTKIFQEFSLPRWGGPRDANNARQLPGYVGFYANMADPATSEEAKRFLRDCSYALMSYVAELYWYGARDGVEGQVAVPDEQRVSYPWRLDEAGRPYVLGGMPDNALTAERLHSEATQANAEWRAACAEQFREIPFLCRFFGGKPE